MKRCEFTVKMPTLTIVETITLDDIRSNPNIQYLFASNLEDCQKEKQSRHIFNNKYNAIGIPIQKTFEIASKNYLSDNEYARNKSFIYDGFDKINLGLDLVIPRKELITELILEIKSPVLFQYIQLCIKMIENIYSGNARRAIGTLCVGDSAVFSLAEELFDKKIRGLIK